MPAEIPVRNVEPRVEIGRSSEPIPHPEDDEILKLIKRSEYKIVDQLLQTPSKISLLALLRDSGAHREALMKVLDQAFVDHDVTVDQFDGIVGKYYFV